jgi:hypothetical protein
MGLPFLQKMIKDRSIDALKFILGTITGSEIASDTIDTDQIATSAVQADELAQSAVDEVLESKYIFQNNLVTNFTTSASTSDDVTSEIINALTTSSPEGNSTQAGAVDSGIRTPLWDHTSGDKILDSDDEVYCELTSSTVLRTAGFNWRNGEDTIQRVSSGTDISVGDIISPAITGGGWYEVVSEVSLNTYQLDRLYDGPDSNDEQANRLRFTLSYYKDVNAVKTAYTMDGRAISFQFKESFTLKDASSAKFADNESTGDVAPVVHNHDTLYTKTTDLESTTQLNSGGDKINVYTAGMNVIPIDNSVQNVAYALDHAAGNVSNESQYTEYPQYEVVASENVMPSLDHTPKDDTLVQVWINGLKAEYTSHYTFSSGVGTWLPDAGNADYTLAVGDEVEYLYPVLESSL